MIQNKSNPVNHVTEHEQCQSFIFVIQIKWYVWLFDILIIFVWAT